MPSTPSPSPRLPLIALAFLFLAISNQAPAQVNQRGESFPAVSLSKIAKAAEIPGLLGTNLQKVAAWYDRSDVDFRALCQRDKSLRADRQGRLHYVCEGLLPLQNAAANAGTTGGAGTTAAGPYPASETFLLHSKPGATKVIYLDFDGHTTTGTYWNSSFTGGAAIVTPPYSTDTDTTTFTATELDNIQNIWQRVTEDYAPFDVDVTTQDPGVEALKKSSSSDLNYGIRVCIGGSSYDWYGAGAGGVAYLNSFTWNTDTPCFVFTAQLGNGAPKYTAEAASHEAGHTYGLNHDGQNGGTEYYQGHANWAPIMGVGYYKDIVQWSKGEYSLANNTQDDTAIIAGICPYRTDAHGDSIVNATPLIGNAPTASGIIERRTDADLFGFSSGSGSISFTATPASPSPNLDIQLSLYDGLGNLIIYSSPSTMGATLTATVAQGSYYVAVDGVGAGDPAIAYSDYASLGQFSIAGAVPPVSGQLPVAVADNSAPTSGPAPLSVGFSSAGSYDPDGAIVAFDWDFGDGASSTSANPVHTYSAPGTYIASLVVVDNSGLSSPADTVTVVVQNNTFVYVAGITMQLSSNKQGYQATASVTVRNQNGQIVGGATVSGTWSGLTSGNVSKSTNNRGIAAFNSARTKNRGTFTFTVTGISAGSIPYDASKNVETTDSISTP